MIKPHYSHTSGPVLGLDYYRLTLTALGWLPYNQKTINAKSLFSRVKSFLTSLKTPKMVLSY